MKLVVNFVLGYNIALWNMESTAGGLTIVPPITAKTVWAKTKPFSRDQFNRLAIVCCRMFGRSPVAF